jgi:hypothetical protein
MSTKGLPPPMETFPRVMVFVAGFTDVLVDFSCKNIRNFGRTIKVTKNGQILASAALLRYFAAYSLRQLSKHKGSHGASHDVLEFFGFLMRNETARAR